MHSVLETLKARGFLSQCTDIEGLSALITQSLAEGSPIGVYQGVDPTAKSMHIGHTAPLYILRHLHDAGLKVVALMGGGTGRIGDPSGKTEMRKLLSYEEIDANVAAIKKQINRFFVIDGATALLANNADWLGNLNYIDFLREIGSHFSVNKMLSFESYKKRLQTGLSFIEFNYQILQSYDYWQLFNRENCRLQIGGDDQWGNIVAGIDLIRRLGGPQAYGLTCPLITRADGKKMGKSEKGAIFLDPSLTSVFDFFQYWRNVDDQDTGRFLKMFTFLPLEECEALAAAEGAALNASKERLAFEVTKLIHGQEEAQNALQAAKALFGGAGDVDAAPSSDLSMERLKGGIEAVELFVQCGLAASKSEARKKLILGGGAFINHKKITDIYAVITDKDLENGALLLRAGKKRFHCFIARS